MRRDPAMLGPALAMVVAFVGSAAHLAPLGTGRTDEYLYPALLLLLAAGAVGVLTPVRAAFDRTSTAAARTAAVGVGVVAVLVAGVLVQRAYSNALPYPGADVPALAAALHREEQPGDHVFVNETMHYPWGFYQDTPLRLEFGTAWSTGFTVVSTDPAVFIVPSETYEGETGRPSGPAT